MIEPGEELGPPGGESSAEAGDLGDGAGAGGGDELLGGDAAGADRGRRDIGLLRSESERGGRDRPVRVILRGPGAVSASPFAFTA